ncbi:hypothetical protein [Chitinibacter tainanensis]|uniref:hypothetical protein n=1 Tax=Chitinibacter tainanensis TaxID=230667 RepID=UPI002352AE29|nr:hypothetical protein [Chitinibacter tainanensis]
MRTRNLGRLTAVANGTPTDLTVSPFLVGNPITVSPSAEAFVGTARLEEADAVGGPFTALAGGTITTGAAPFEIVTTKRFLRLACTAFTSGAISASLSTD